MRTAAEPLLVDCIECLSQLGIVHRIEYANAHGPNEFLHVDYAKKLTACVSLVLADHAKTVS